MALKAAIMQEDGVVTNYHRIRILDLMVNVSNSIAIYSYVDEAARNAEKEGTMKPYVRSITYFAEYDSDMNVSKAYEWLKENVAEFANAEDLFEEVIQ